MRKRTKIEVLDHDRLKKELKVKKLPPVYYIKNEVTEEIVNHFNKEGTFFNMESTERTEELLSRRPFDEMVVITQGYFSVSASEKELEQMAKYGIDDFIISTIVYVWGDNICDHRIIIKDRDHWSNTTIKDQIKGVEDWAGRGVEHDMKVFKLNARLIECSFIPFAAKKNRIYLCSGAAKKEGSKKNKYKKQKFLYLSNTLYETSEKVAKLDKVESISCTSVAGHRRIFDNQNWTGHNRNGGEVKGWTWVRPYERGKGKEHMDKIRMWVR